MFGLKPAACGKVAFRRCYAYNAAMRDTVVYRGITFTRYPESQSLSSRRYYYPSKHLRQKGVKALHQEIWRDHFGPIPTKHVIHHKDGDTLNNDISNLECIPPGAHTLKHAGSTPARRESAARARLLTVAWHRSPEGRQWHREHGARAWKARQPTAKTCVECGQPWQSLARREADKFCSRTCWQRYHYRNKSYWVTSCCPICAKSFLGPGKKKTCSRSCGVTLGHRLRKTE
jgi:hypothetical protein